jgi:DnaJ-class molecular chaperone with C-terminal Zn finger domain
MDDSIRVSDADRDRVTAQLRDHFAAGRITPGELDERLSAALNAKTFGDLRRIMADLPGPVPAPLGAAPPLRATPAWAIRRRHPPFPPLILLALLAALLIPGTGWLLAAFVNVILLFWLMTFVVGALPSAGRSGGGTTTVAGSAPGTPRGATARGYDGAATLARVRSRPAQARRRSYASRRRPGQPRSTAASRKGRGMTASTADYYGILGLTSDATLADVKKAYRKLARQHHPDRNNADPGAIDRFRRITEAYEYLSAHLKDNAHGNGHTSPARPPPQGPTSACQAGTPRPPAAC